MFWGVCYTKDKYAFKWVLLSLMANVQSDTVGRGLLAEALPCVSPREVLGGGRGPTGTAGEPRKPCKRRKGGEYFPYLCLTTGTLIDTNLTHPLTGRQE